MAVTAVATYIVIIPWYRRWHESVIARSGHQSRTGMDALLGRRATVTQEIKPGELVRSRAGDVEDDAVVGVDDDFLAAGYGGVDACNGRPIVRMPSTNVIDLREQVYDFPSQQVITRDNVTTEINCFSMATRTLSGGVMSCSSTRLTLTPHLLVASSRITCSLELMVSREVRVSSSSSSPMTLRRAARKSSSTPTTASSSTSPARLLTLNS
mgnify:CR=1 FL=1